MKVLVGLGNPEPEYSNTRHNIGKELVNLYSESHGVVSWENHPKSKCQFVKMEDFYLLKPTGYMNVVGADIKNFMGYHNIKIEDLIVAYDELDLFVGEYKFLFGKGTRIHNGVIDLRNVLGTDQFWHLRIGVRDETIPMSVQKAGKDPSKYVLEKFPQKDLEKILNVIKDNITPALNKVLSKN